MNLRLSFDKFKIEFETIIDNLKFYVKSDEDANKPIIFMQSYTEIVSILFYIIIFLITLQYF